MRQPILSPWAWEVKREEGRGAVAEPECPCGETFVSARVACSNRQSSSRLRAGDDPTFGDAYCFTALERNTMLILTWHLGPRTARDTEAFTEKLNEATAGNFQITTDGFKPYREAISYS